MASTPLYMFFEHGGGEYIYSLYKVNLHKDALPSKESLISQIRDPQELTPTLLFERKLQRFPSGMRCVLFDSKFYFLGGEKELEDYGQTEFKDSWEMEFEDSGQKEFEDSGQKKFEDSGETEFEDSGQKEFEDYQKKRYPSDVFIFDPAKATDAAVGPANTKDSVKDLETPMTTGKPEPLLLFVFKKKMYALSSPHLSLNIPIKYFEKFDPIEKKWTPLPSPPLFKRGYLDMQQAVVNKKIYIMAGQYRTSNDFALHCFDLVKEKWITLLKCPALPLRYSIAGFAQDTVYGFFNESIVGFGPVENTDDEEKVGEFFNRLLYFSPEGPADKDDDGEFFKRLLPADEDGDKYFKRLLGFSPEGPVNFLKLRPIMVDTSSALMHLGNKCFCYVLSGNPPLDKDTLPEDAEYLTNDPLSRYISLTIFRALSDTFTDEDGDTCFKAKFQHSAHYFAKTTWDTGFAMLRDCMFIPVEFKVTVEFVFYEGDLTDPYQFLGQGVSLQLISAVNGDPGKPAYLEEWRPLSTATYKVTFDWDEGIGVPEAFYVRNNLDSAFHLKTLKVEDVPGQGPIHFDCNSQIRPATNYIFFTNEFLKQQMKQEMLHNIIDAITGDHDGKKIKGRVVLMKKHYPLHETFGAQGVSLELIGDTAIGGKLGKPAYLEEWLFKTTPGESGAAYFEQSITKSTPSNSSANVAESYIENFPSAVWEFAFKVTFDWYEEIGVPGAFIVRCNHLDNEFYLKTLTLENVPGQGRIHFVCNSWVHSDRVFFANKTCLPSETPMPLRKCREEELLKLRGNRKGELQECDRVYDYDFYNDLWDLNNDLKDPDVDTQFYLGFFKFCPDNDLEDSDVDTRFCPSFFKFCLIFLLFLTCKFRCIIIDSILPSAIGSNLC